MDFTEISVTGVPVHTGPRFSVIAGKALVDDAPEVVETHDDDITASIQRSIESLNTLFDNLSHRGKSNQDNSE
jgi:hypothetical protein